jgi:hypothetical protein
MRLRLPSRRRRGIRVRVTISSARGARFADGATYPPQRHILSFWTTSDTSFERWLSLTTPAPARKRSASW